jgi:glycosyltransferase involved in cell wall biosynthesis
MKFLFVFYIPTGGVEALNRYRSEALRLLGHETHCLYYRSGPGLQNKTDMITFITNDDCDIEIILKDQQYDAIVVTTDHLAFSRFRNLGFKGKFILEIQGYGPKSVARTELTKAIPYVNAYVAALLNPCTPHIASLFDELFPHIPKFHFNNPFNAHNFSYISLTVKKKPIIGWIGRIEDNKNWREFLAIAHRLLRYKPKLKFWIFEDPTFTNLREREAFFQLIHRYKLKPYIRIYNNLPHAQMKHQLSIIGDSGGFLCSTSKEEGAPYSFLEAMNCRCPVLSSDKDGVYQSLIHNYSGKMYPLGNIKLAVTEALELMDNRAFRKSLIDQAQIHVTSNFSLEAYGNKFMNMMDAIRD